MQRFVPVEELLKGRHFDQEIVVLNVRCYLSWLRCKFARSGIPINFADKDRWDARARAEAARAEEQARKNRIVLALKTAKVIERHSGQTVTVFAPTGEAWIKLCKPFVYRAVQIHPLAASGRTVESHLSRTRDAVAAKAFFRKALKHHGEPRTITLDGFEPSHSALRRMGMRNELNYRWEKPVKIRSCQYLNNMVEQDHRRIKARVQSMVGFKTFYNARRVLMGIELMQMMPKGQFHTVSLLSKTVQTLWRGLLKTRELAGFQWVIWVEVSCLNCRCLSKSATIPWAPHP